MKKIILLVPIVVALCNVASFADGIVRKSLGDINGDGKKEIAIENTSSGSMVFTDVKIQSGDRTILVLPILCGDSADGYKIIGKQIVVWNGDWDAESSKWKPHYFNFTWYSWDANKKKYVAVQKGSTSKSYSYEDSQRSMPLLAKNPGKNLNIQVISNQAKKPQSSRTIEEAVKLYCLDRPYPGWAKPPFSESFAFKKIRGEWVSIATYVVDSKGQMASEYCTFLVHKVTSNWSVVWWADEKVIHPKLAQSLGISKKIVQELGWQLTRPGPQDDM